VFCSPGRPYAFGVVIEAINLTTINEKGESIYIDRTDSKNKNEPLYKKLNIQGLSIYWSDNPQVILSTSLTSDELDKQIDGVHKKIEDKDFLLKPCNILNLVSLEVLLKYDNHHKEADPLCTLSIQVESLLISLRKSQYDQILFFSSITESYALMQSN
jgi:hypothetical protein